MSAPEYAISDSDVADMARNWNEYHDCTTIRDLALDLRESRRRIRELETQLELMTCHRNRLLDKRAVYADV